MLVLIKYWLFIFIASFITWWIMAKGLGKPITIVQTTLLWIAIVLIALSLLWGISELAQT